MRFTAVLAPLAIVGASVVSAEETIVSTMTSTVTSTSTITRCHPAVTSCPARATGAVASAAAVPTAAVPSAPLPSPVWPINNSTRVNGAAAASTLALLPSGGIAGVPGSLNGGAAGPAPTKVPTSAGAKGLVAMSGVVAAALAAAMAIF